MENQESICSQVDCEFQSILNSDNCWIHSESQKIQEAIQFLKGNENDVYISNIELNNHIFNDINFDKLVISDTHIRDVEFNNCFFRHSGFLYSTLDNVIFRNCEFEDIEWTSSYIQINSEFENCSFIDNRFSSCKFQDNPRFVDLTFEESNFVSCYFYKIDIIKNLKFHRCMLSETTLTEVNSISLQFEDCDFIQAIFYNSNFINSNFNNVAHNFDRGDYPRLCDFTDFKFVNMTLPDEFYIWNNVDENKIEFYTRIISIIKKEDHPNHLQELNDCIDKLYGLGLDSDLILINTIKSIYDEKIKLFGRDFSTLGSIFKHIHQLPNNIKPQGKLSLPMNNEKLEDSKIRIKIKCDDWSVNNIAEFQNELVKINQAFNRPLVVESIEKGSLIQTLSGNLEMIVTIAKLLGKLATAVFLILKGKLYLEKSILSNKKLRFEAEHQQEEYDRNALKTDLENKSIELILLSKEKEVKQKTLERINEIGVKHIPNFNQIIEGEIGTAVKKRLPVINKKFPLEEVEVYISIFPK